MSARKYVAVLALSISAVVFGTLAGGSAVGIPLGITAVVGAAFIVDRLVRATRAPIAEAELRMSAQAEALDRLRDEAAMREEILSSMSEGVLLASSSGDILFANAAAQILLGAVSALPGSLERPGTTDITVHHPVRRELRAASVPLDEGRMLVVIRDVTDATRIDTMRRDFVANASHELKTPVGGILATAETLASASKDDPASVPRFTQMLLREARRLSDLVGDLLDLARLEQEPGRTGNVDLSEVVTREVARARPQAEAKQLNLDALVDPHVTISGDLSDLALAVRNLLDNAVRYTTEGSVTVRLQADNVTARLEVSDTGPGIAAKHHDRIFERFYRVDVARTRETGGTGLGLSIVKHVAERHGGAVSAESELGRGSVFVLTLPTERST